MTSCSSDIQNTPLPKEPIPSTAETAVFAGGCFWCIETAFDGQEGVYDAISGYAGGEESEASYALVSKGNTKHREAVQVYYDPQKISYEKLLDIFWRQIDPTDDGGQFADRGFHYTTAIYYQNEVEESLAKASKEALKISGKFSDPIVTEILPFTTFFKAEEKHQDFAKKQALYYQRYKKGSGRAGFIEDVWEK